MFKKSSIFLLFVIFISFLFADEIIVYPVVFDENDNIISYETLKEKKVDFQNISAYINSPIPFIARIKSENEKNIKFPIKIFWNLNNKNSYFINSYDYVSLIEKGYLQTTTTKTTQNIKVQILKIKDNKIIGTGKYKEILLNENESLISIMSLKEGQDELVVYSPDIITTSIKNIFQINYISQPSPAFDILLNNSNGLITINTQTKEIIKAGKYQLKINVREGNLIQPNIIIQLPEEFYFVDDLGNKIKENDYLTKYFIYRFKNKLPETKNEFLAEIIKIKNERLVVFNPTILTDEFAELNFEIAVDIEKFDLSNKAIKKIKIILPDYNYTYEAPLFVTTEKSLFKIGNLFSYVIEDKDNDSIKLEDKIKYQLVIYNNGTEDILLNSINYTCGKPEINTMFLLDNNNTGELIKKFSFPFMLKSKDKIIINYQRKPEKKGYNIENIEINYDLFYRELDNNLKKINDMININQITLVK